MRYDVNDVVLEGVTRFEKREFLKYLHVGETTWVPFIEDKYYNEALAPTDIDRILKLYYAFGYHEAEVTAYRILRKDGQEVDVLIAVKEGKPVRISLVNVQLSDSRNTPTDPPIPNAPDIRTLTDTNLKIKANDPLEVPTIENAMDRLVLALKSEGFPFADATVRVNKTAKYLATVKISVSPGPFARIGNISVTGLNSIPETSVITEVDFAVKKPYSPKLLARMERRVYAMGNFSTVEISTTGNVTHGTVGLRVAVTEAKPQSIKVGVSLAFESARWDQGVRLNYTHRNFFKRRWHLDTRLRVGYAELPSPITMREHGPTVLFQPRMTKKGWLEKRLVWIMAPGFELGVQEGYQFYAPSTQLGISRLFDERFLVELSHFFKFYDFFDVSKTLGANKTALGLDYRDPYMLSYVELNTALYFTDDQTDPTNGVVIGNRYQVAGPFGGHYSFHKLVPHLSAYWQVHSRVQLAFRAETGYIFPWGKRAGAPFNLQFYLGGADTVRGWGQRRLSPKTQLCPTDGTKCRAVPIGGKTEVLANAEIRVRTYKQFFVAAFVDMGDVQPGEVAYRPNEWNYTAGGGLRYGSPIGKLRVDVGARLNDSPLSKGEARWAFHLGFGEAF